MLLGVENVTRSTHRNNAEYLGWHSHNLRVVNCHVTDEQPPAEAYDLVFGDFPFGLPL